MKSPDISSTISGYVLLWDDAGLCVEVKRLDVHSTGRVTGDLEIRNGNAEKPVILLPSTQFNFSSEQTRSRSAKSLKEKYPESKVEWVELFDYLGHKVQEIARTGEPVEEIWASEEVEAPELLMEPLLIKGVPNIIFGEKGIAKSTIAYAAGGILALGWQENPLGMVVPDRSINSLILDWETDRPIFEYYLSRLLRGTFDNKSFPLYYRKCRLPLVEELESIEKYVEERNVEVLIIDSLAAAAGGENSELKGSQASLQFNSALRKLNTTSLIIAQTSKNLEGKKSIYGSTLFTYYGRNIFELSRSEDDDSNIVHLGLFHRECNLARKHSPIGFELRFDDANKSISIEREPLNIGEFAEKVTTRSRILDALKRGPMSVDDLGDLLKLRRNTINQALSRLKSSDKIVKVGDKWGLMADTGHLI